MDNDAKEKDVNMDEVRQLCAGKTVDELDAEFEEFKRQFVEQHKKN